MVKKVKQAATSNANEGNELDAKAGSSGVPADEAIGASDASEDVTLSVDAQPPQDAGRASVKSVSVEDPLAEKDVDANPQPQTPERRKGSLVGEVLAIQSGEKAVITLSHLDKSATFVVYFDAKEAHGDMGQKVPGFITGEYEVWYAKDREGMDLGRNLLRQHVSPGEPGGMQQTYAAEQCAQTMKRFLRQYC